MPHKKKSFTKNNSVKFLLLCGNPQATNADGETLQNVLVPVSKNYKPGSSLLMSNIGSIFGSEPVESNAEEPDLEKIMEEFDSESDDCKVENLNSKMEHLTFVQKIKKSKLSDSPKENRFEDCSDDDSNYSFIDCQFANDSDSTDHDCNIPNDCPENIKIFNARFEKVLEEYDDCQIGPLDEEEICGYLSHDSERIKNIIDSELKHKNFREEIVLGNFNEDLKEKILNYAEDNSEEETVEIVTEKPLEFDCESILSTYSNKYNHPTVIKEEKVKKIKIPNNPLKKRLTKSQLKTLNSESEDDEFDDNISVDTSINVRHKGETPEERRQRKSLFKDAKRESRILKKENKLAFKQEKKIQKAQNLNSQYNSGIKLL